MTDSFFNFIVDLSYTFVCVMVLCAMAGSMASSISSGIAMIAAGFALNVPWAIYNGDIRFDHFGLDIASLSAPALFAGFIAIMCGFVVRLMVSMLTSPAPVVHQKRAAHVRGSAAEHRPSSSDSLLDVSNPASLLSPLNVANPASPLHSLVMPAAVIDTPQPPSMPDIPSVPACDTTQVQMPDMSCTTMTNP